MGVIEFISLVGLLISTVVTVLDSTGNAEGASGANKIMKSLQNLRSKVSNRQKVLQSDISQLNGQLTSLQSIRNYVDGRLKGIIDAAVSKANESIASKTREISALDQAVNEGSDLANQFQRGGGMSDLGSSRKSGRIATQITNLGGNIDEPVSETAVQKAASSQSRFEPMANRR